MADKRDELEMKVSATQLRKDIYRLLDSVLETGIPIEVSRKGRTLKIITENPPSKLKNLKGIPNLINGDPAELEEIDWSEEWQP